MFILGVGKGRYSTPIQAIWKGEIPITINCFYRGKTAVFCPRFPVFLHLEFPTILKGTDLSASGASSSRDRSALCSRPWRRCARVNANENERGC